MLAKNELPVTASDMDPPDAGGRERELRPEVNGPESDSMPDARRRRVARKKKRWTDGQKSERAGDRQLKAISLSLRFSLLSLLCFKDWTGVPTPGCNSRLWDIAVWLVFLGMRG